MKTLSDSGPLVRLLSLRWQLPCNFLVNELPKMTHCWILLAPSGQLVFRDFLGFEIFCVFLLWATSRSGFPFFCFYSFPLLTMSPLLLQFLPSSCEKPRSFNLYYNQRLSHGIVSACWRLPAKAFATKNNTTTLWYNHREQYNHTTTKNNTNQTTRHPHSRTKHPTNNPTHTTN